MELVLSKGTMRKKGEKMEGCRSKRGIFYISEPVLCSRCGVRGSKILQSPSARNSGENAEKQHGTCKHFLSLSPCVVECSIEVTVFVRTRVVHFQNAFSGKLHHPSMFSH